jgi:hypothetical protein
MFLRAVIAEEENHAGQNDNHRHNHSFQQFLNHVVHDKRNENGNNAFRTDLLTICTELLNATIFNNQHQSSSSSFEEQLYQHLACIEIQNALRSKLPSLGAVAFIANGSILPRKSGSSDVPMMSPPAVPFLAPSNSPMTQSISVEISGGLSNYLPTASPFFTRNDTTVTFTGLLVPEGVTLICGGGYHGTYGDVVTVYIVRFPCTVVISYKWLL